MRHACLHRPAARWLVAATLFLGATQPIRAQELHHATVALVRDFPDTAATATIIHTAERTLVLLRERDADAATLATAMSSVSRMREGIKDGPDKKLVITVHGSRRLTALSPNERQLGEFYLARLRAARAERVDGIGTARVTTIPLARASTTALR